MSKETALQIVPSADMRALIETNLGGQLDLSLLDRVKMPAGGGIAFEVPTIDGVDPRKAIEGVVLYVKFQNVYWAQALEDANGAPPDCVATDGRHGAGNPGGLCSTCPYNKFGSDADGGRGKACRNNMLVFLQEKGKVLPLVVVLPPTSIPIMRKYLGQLTSIGTMYFHVVTRFALTTAQSKDGFKYSVIAPPIRVKEYELSEQEKIALENYRAGLIPALDGVVMTDEFTE